VQLRIKYIKDSKSINLKNRAKETFRLFIFLLFIVEPLVFHDSIEIPPCFHYLLLKSPEWSSVRQKLEAGIPYDHHFGSWATTECPLILLEGLILRLFHDLQWLFTESFRGCILHNIEITAPKQCRIKIDQLSSNNHFTWIAMPPVVPNHPLIPPSGKQWRIFDFSRILKAAEVVFLQIITSSIGYALKAIPQPGKIARF